MTETLIKGWGASIIQAVIAAALVIGGFTVYPSVYRVTHPAASYFTVEEIRVEDMQANAEGRVWYGRSTTKEHRADWKVTIYRATIQDGSLQPVCSGNAPGVYNPRSSRPRYVTLSWFIGTDCPENLDPGFYKMRVSWVLTDPPTNELVAAWSNEFEVHSND